MTRRTGSNRRKTLWRLAVVALMVIVLWPVGAWAAARLLIVREPMTQVDAIVVLSGSATFRERMQHAAALYSEGRAQRIILTNDNLKSGWSSAAQRNPYYHELAKEELVRAGVPAQNIEIIMVPIVGTHDEALKLKEYCEKHGIRSIVVVTSAYHSRRALWTFRRIFEGTGKQIGIDPADAGIETPAPATWWLHRTGWEMVPTEYVKMMVYRMRI
jgi:uncharacterized SAM-binding protein YcdF (DUF218 family)